MGEYIQIGVTALRDPITGDFMPAVPIYVRAEDQASVAETMNEDLKALFAGKMKQYRTEAAKAKKRPG